MAGYDFADNRTISRAPEGAKLQKTATFEKGDNFIKFCKRFRENVILSGINGPGIGGYFLSYIKCESTWEKLQKLTSSRQENHDIDAVIERCINELYPPVHAWNTRAQLLSLKQSRGESVEEFCRKLEELAYKAGYGSREEREKSCLQTLMTGTLEQLVRIKLYEAGTLSYQDAVKLAITTEQILKITSVPNEEVPIREIKSGQVNSPVGRLRAEGNYFYGHSNKGRSNMGCWYCGERDHCRRDCFILKSERGDMKPRVGEEFRVPRDRVTSIIRPGEENTYTMPMVTRGITIVTMGSQAANLG